MKIKLIKKSASETISTSLRRFELHSGKTQKFWEVRRQGCKFELRWGAIGRGKQYFKTMEFSKIEKATETIERLTTKKTTEGYDVVYDSFDEKIPKLVAGSMLQDALMRGATFLRTVYHGSEDDGFFENEFFKGSEPLVMEDFDNLKLDEEIQSILNLNDTGWDGNNDGSVGVIEIDLTTGRGLIRQSRMANIICRFAEFIAHLEWGFATTASCVLNLSKDEENDGWVNIENKKMKTDARRFKKKLKEYFENLVGYIACSEAGGIELKEEILSKLGNSANLIAHVYNREFVFEGNGKKLKIKIPQDQLERDMAQFYVIFNK
jgi:predicted DNA-binding WGR domain protein